MNDKMDEKTSGKKVKNNLISEEVAQDQLDILTDFYDVDLEDSDDTSKKVAKKRLLRAIQQGRLTITSQGGLKVTQILQNPPGEISEIPYRIITGADRARMEKIAGDNAYDRMYALAGMASGVGEKAIKSLFGADLAVAEGLSIVFLGL